MSENLKTFFAIILITALMLGYRGFYLSRLDTFSSGKIIESSKTHKKFSCNYAFNVLGRRYEGFYTDISRPSEFKKEGEFLIGYDASNPDYSYIFFNYPINSLLMVDSLNNCCNPIQFINFGDYLSGS